MILLIISFLAGVLTILAPCTLPLLPVIVGSAVNGQGKQKPNLKKAFVIAASLGTSIVAFTVLLKISTLFINIPQVALGYFSGFIILIFGFISLFPTTWERIPFIAKLNATSNKLMSTGYKKQSITGDIIIGASLGPVFSTCSPTYFIILATVLPQSFAFGFACLLAYAVGLAGVLLLVAFLGQKLVSRLGGISDTHGWFKKALGILFILIGLAVIFGLDRKLQTVLLQSNFFDITTIEQKLLKLNDKSLDVTGTPAPEIVNPSGFINTEDQPITIAQFKGEKVVLLDIWTYTCINCQRTIPYLVAWDKKYRDLGLEIIGLHTPEFAFEKVEKNVENAVKGFGIEYPVVLDNDYSTWNAFGNNYWPRKYLINKDSFITYDHIGEGEYAETERAIQKALMELNAAKGNRVVVPTDLVVIGSAASPEQGKVKSPEIYFGALRNEYLGNGDAGQTGERTFVLPGAYEKNKLYFEGKWNVNREGSQNTGPGKIVFKYEAKKVYMVASSDLPEGIMVNIKQDGNTVQTLTIKENILYTIIDNPHYGEHLLEIEIPQAGLEAFTFTFG